MIRWLLALVLLLAAPLAAAAQMSLTDGTLATPNTAYERGRGGVPTMGTCGTTPAVTGTDGAGTITQASGALTTCTLNFSTTYTPAPFCVVSATDNTTILKVDPNTTSLIILSATHAGTSISYRCLLP